EGVEEGETVLGRGRQVAADRAELPGAGEGAQAPGYFLSQLDHADVALGSVVVRWHSPVSGESQVVVLAVEQAAGQGVLLFHQLPGAGGGLAGPDQGRGAVRPGPAGQT